MYSLLLSLFFPHAYAQSKSEIQDYLMANPTKDPEFQKGILNHV